MDRKKTLLHTLLTVVTSAAVISSLGTVCFAGTISNRPVGAIKTSEIEVKPKEKPSPTRIMHPAFKNAGQTPGLEIWRIENFEPVAYSKNNYGKFFTGDSFIVLNTKQSKDKKTLTWDIHFWLGSETSVDEAGAAAILTVQLDDILNGGPVQHREVQDHESSQFLSYFKNGVRYEKGGVGPGFKHVNTNDQGSKRLFQVKGKRNVRVREVNFSFSSMNNGDCFILDAGSNIYVYVGRQAQRVEKIKATSAANQIRDQDHNGRAKVHIIDESSTEMEKENFFTILGSGSSKEIPDASTAEEDSAFETADERSVSLFKVTDNSGSVKIEQISQKPLKQEMLNSQDCFILDTGSGIYVWVGRTSNQKEKADSMKKAQEFLNTKKYPAWTQIHRIVEGAESASFKQYFSTWKDANMLHTRLIRSALGYETDEIDFAMDEAVLSNLIRNGGCAIGFMPDNGSGKITKMFQLTEEMHTGNILRNEIASDNHILYGSDSYIMVYEYKEKSGEKAIVVYVWEGSKTTDVMKTESFKLGVELGEDLAATVVRAVQGHEPRHFLRILKGKLITTFGKTSTDVQLFRIQGTDEKDVRANEVVARSSSLFSDDVFALVNPELRKVYIWIGLGASMFERNMVEFNLNNFWELYDKEILKEGAETDDFWESLHGEGMYDKTIENNTTALLDTSLFYCKITKKHIKFEEIGDFEQSDLDTSDIMLLDAGDEIYIWVGSEATSEERNKVLKVAKEYIKPKGRNIDTVTIVRIQQGNEPTSFKEKFPFWENSYWNINLQDSLIMKM